MEPLLLLEITVAVVLLLGLTALAILLRQRNRPDGDVSQN